eukprot:gene6651-7536_t
MADRKAVSKWIPPDFDPKKTHSINAYHGSHPLRERARKIKQGILVIRFEAPWDFWCTSCNSHIGRGVRWNAEKKKVGNYYTTPIYAFSFKCHVCSGSIVFETDPKNCDYRISEGGRRKLDTWDTDDAESIVVPDDKEKQKRAQNPMYMLEHQASDVAKASKERPAFVRLYHMKSKTSKHDYDVNSVLRNSFRREKKRKQAQQEADEKILAKNSLQINLLPESEDDVLLAKSVKFGEPQLSVTDVAKKEKRAIKQASIFDHQADRKSKPTTIKQSLLNYARVAAHKHIPNSRLLGKKQTPSFANFSSNHTHSTTAHTKAPLLKDLIRINTHSTNDLVESMRKSTNTDEHYLAAPPHTGPMRSGGVSDNNGNFQSDTKKASELKHSYKQAGGTCHGLVDY